ncbi:hypothetical protein [Nocardia sp. CA-145437]|uniref:hypothetical protein n=1 Tax=Nocardia sp. CA-145437 TaxID=3239980 RepID=UPI003D978304
MSSPIRGGAVGRARDAYRGPTIHCTHWRDQYELDRLHVAVIGGGAALAKVVPPVAEQARRVTVFQHDPVWIVPTPPVPGIRLVLDRLPADALGTLPAHSAPPLPGDSGSRLPADSAAPRSGDLRAPVGSQASPTASGRGDRVGHRNTWPGALGRVGFDALRWGGRQALRRAAAANLRAQVGDSWVRRQLTPDQRAAVRVHGRYYRALRQPNCTLVSWPIARIAPLGIRTVDGVEHRVDCIIYAEDAS